MFQEDVKYFAKKFIIYEKQMSPYFTAAVTTLRPFNKY